MSKRIDASGNRTRPHVCGKNCPNDHRKEAMARISGDVDRYITDVARRNRDSE